MARKGSDDARLHSKQGAEIAWNTRNLNHTMSVVQGLVADVEQLKTDMSEVKRDIKVSKSTWMREEAQRRS